MILPSCCPFTRQDSGKSNPFSGQEHIQLLPLSTVLAWGYGDHHHQKARALDWHVLRKDANSITKVAFHETPEGKQKCGQLKTTWQRTVKAEMKNMNHNWGTIQWLGSDRQGRRSFVPAVYTNWHDGWSLRLNACAGAVCMWVLLSVEIPPTVEINSWSTSKTVVACFPHRTQLNFS